MLNSKGVSMVSLVITIIVIVIIAAISTPLLSSVIDDAFTKDIKEEVANVENVLAYAKSQIMIDEFTPNQKYLASGDDLDKEFRQSQNGLEVLTNAEKEYILEVNSNPNISDYLKYYIMDQEAFDNEFGNGFNIDNIRGDRKYLVNYYDGTVVANYNGTRISNIELGQIKDTAVVERGDVTVSIYPNGDTTWFKNSYWLKKIDNTTNVVVKFSYRDKIADGIVGAVQINEVRYLWSDKTTQPSDDLFNGSGSHSASINSSNKQFVAEGIEGKTGSNWCLWIRIKYTEEQTGRDIIKYVHSNPFFLDNTAPSAELSITEVK